MSIQVSHLQASGRLWKRKPSGHMTSSPGNQQHPLKYSAAIRFVRINLGMFLNNCYEWNKDTPFNSVTQETPRVLEKGTGTKNKILICYVTLGASCQESRSEVKCYTHSTLTDTEDSAEKSHSVGTVTLTWEARTGSCANVQLFSWTHGSEALGRKRQINLRTCQFHQSVACVRPPGQHGESIQSALKIKQMKMTKAMIVILSFIKDPRQWSKTRKKNKTGDKELAAIGWLSHGAHIQIHTRYTKLNWASAQHWELRKAATV